MRNGWEEAIPGPQPIRVTLELPAGTYSKLLRRIADLGCVVIEEVFSDEPTAQTDWEEAERPITVATYEKFACFAAEHTTSVPGNKSSELWRILCNTAENIKAEPEIINLSTLGPMYRVGGRLYNQNDFDFLRSLPLRFVKPEFAPDDMKRWQLDVWSLYDTLNLMAQGEYSLFKLGPNRVGLLLDFASVILRLDLDPGNA